MHKPKILRIVTAPISMNIILKGQLAYMNQHFEVVGVTAYDEKHFNEIKNREGIRMHAVSLARAISPLQDLKALWQIIRIIRHERPDIVHSHTPKAGLLGMLAAWLLRVPVRMHTVGGMPLMEVTGLKRRLLNLLERITYGCAHRVYPNSKGLFEFIVEQKFCPPTKLKVLANGGSNGINTDHFSPDFWPNALEERQKMRQSLGITESDLVFCFVGRIAREKGMGELLTAFERLQKHHSIKLILVGTFEKHYGVLDAQVVQAIENNPDILFLGRFDDVRPYYALSDVFVFPTYREGFPNALLEAGAMQLPCIATDINGCNEIVQHRRNGLLIPPKSEVALHDAMLEMIAQPDERTQLAQQARQDIVAMFRREFVWNSLLEEYRNLLKNANNGLKKNP
jgi:glycosyltransferase involved in cell wall biosynthesis